MSVTERPDAALPSYPGEDSARSGSTVPNSAPTDAIVSPRRWPWIAVLVLGAVLTIAPLAGGMFYPAAQGQAMIGAFEPYMTTDRLDGFRADLDRLAAARAATVRLDSANRIDAGQFPQIDGFQTQYGGIDADMTGLLDRIDSARGDFGDLAAMRPLDVIPFVPVGAGLLLIAAGVWGLRRRHTVPGRMGAATLVLAVAVGLVAYPVATSMVSHSRAATPLLDRFDSVVTAGKVRDIQGYFVVLVGAVGQVDSSYRTAVDTPVSPRADLVAVDDLSASWQRMSSDFAGLIGTLNDNVKNYAGVARLNDRTDALGVGAFALLPWFLIGSGVLAAVLGTVGLLGRTRRRTTGAR
ncbi:hypothetical protein [Williamsia sp. M5A3_1d]